MYFEPQFQWFRFHFCNEVIGTTNKISYRWSDQFVRLPGNFAVTLKSIDPHQQISIWERPHQICIPVFCRRLSRFLFDVFSYWTTGIHVHLACLGMNILHFTKCGFSNLLAVTTTTDSSVVFLFVFRPSCHSNVKRERQCREPMFVLSVLGYYRNMVDLW